MALTYLYTECHAMFSTRLGAVQKCRESAPFATSMKTV